MPPAELPDAPLEARGRGRGRGRRWPAYVAAIALATAWLGAGAAWWWSASDAHATVIDPRWTATVVVLAGDGVPGRRDGEASRARFADPFGVAVAPDGTVYVADAGETPAIRAIAPDGRVSTIAGGERAFTDGLGSAARFDTPSGLAIDSNGVLYVADTGNHAIRRVTPEGHVSTVAGDGVAGDRDGAGARHASTVRSASPCRPTVASSSPTRTTIGFARSSSTGPFARWPVDPLRGRRTESVLTRDSTRRAAWPWTTTASFTWPTPAAVSFAPSNRPDSCARFPGPE